MTSTGDEAESDQALVSLAAGGDADAFARLLRRHDDKMRGVVWRLLATPAAMDDVLQDAYLKAWKGLPGFRGDAAFTSWLYRIVYTTTLDHLKRVRRRAEVPFATGTEAPSVDPTGWVPESLAIRAALAALPAEQLLVVTLVDGQGRSYGEVADVLGISEGTVASRLSRARANLRKRLNPSEGDDQ